MRKGLNIFLTILVVFNLSGCTNKLSIEYFENSDKNSFQDLDSLVSIIDESLNNNYVSEIYHPWHYQKGSPGSFTETYSRNDLTKYNEVNQLNFYKKTKINIVRDFLTLVTKDISNYTTVDSFKEGREININDKYILEIYLEEDDLYIDYHTMDSTDITQRIIVYNAFVYSNMEIEYLYKENIDNEISKYINISFIHGEEKSVMYENETIEYVEVKENKDFFRFLIMEDEDYNVFRYDSEQEELYYTYSNDTLIYQKYSDGHVVYTFDIIEQDAIAYNLHHVFGWDKLVPRTESSINEGIDIYLGNELISNNMTINHLSSDQFYLVLDIESMEINDDNLSLSNIGLSSFLTRQLFILKSDMTIDKLVDNKPVYLDWGKMKREMLDN